MGMKIIKTALKNKMCLEAASKTQQHGFCSFPLSCASINEFASQSTNAIIILGYGKDVINIILKLAAFNR